MEELKQMVEALLFASGKAFSIEQMISLTKSEKKDIKKVLNKLKGEYDDRKSSLMLVEEDDSWKITVREGYLPLVRKIVADTELSKTIIETLAVIAWRAPVSQSTVIKIRTNKAYDHISELERLGFVIKEKDSRTFKLKLTEKFFDYFDISGNKDIREIFKNVKGVENELEEEVEKHESELLDSNSNSNLTDLNSISLENNASSEHLGKLEVFDEKSSEPEIVKDVEDVVSEIDFEEEKEEIIESEIDVIKESDILAEEQKEKKKHEHDAQDLIDNS